MPVTTTKHKAHFIVKSDDEQSIQLELMVNKSGKLAIRAEKNLPGQYANLSLEDVTPETLEAIAACLLDAAVIARKEKF